MEKPRSFAGRVIRKGKVTTNDYAQPEKFFADMEHCLRIMEEIPFSAVEDLKKYELNREIMINVIRRAHLIIRAADIDVIEEIKRLDEDPFDGLEEDIKKKTTFKIS